MKLLPPWLPVFHHSTLHSGIVFASLLVGKKAVCFSIGPFYQGQTLLRMMIDT